MRKGVIGILIFTIFVVVVIEAATIQYLLSTSYSSKATARETNIIQGINKFELNHRYLEQALKYSFYQAFRDISQDSSYLKYSVADSLYCIPYFKIYDETTITDFNSKIEESTEQYFKKYTDEIKDDETIIPDYDVAISLSGSDIVVEARPDGKLQLYREGKLEISDDKPIKVLIDPLTDSCP
ncbi:hypothetical protein A3K63_01380 [Candidatus Micrarchaeota archaeon RBG_16_49_10]|nr:MAG: hypothetical protein A3K63_01380 [Candidatus Micrarchaeota archaeon RBG_16_49_10]